MQNSVKVFEARKVQKDWPYKLISGDFFNDFIYLGDDRGNIYKYPVKADQSQVIQRSAKDEPRQLGTKSKVDKIVSFVETGMIIVLSDEKLFAFDAALNKPDVIKEKVHDFSPNQSFGAPCNLGLAITTKKKEAIVFNWNSGLRKFEEQNKVMISQLPSCLGYTRNHIVLGLKRQYQILNTQESFAMKKLPLEINGNPFFKVTNRDEILFFQEQVGIFMSPEATPRQRNPCVLRTNKPVIDVALSPNFCFVLFQGIVEVFNTYDPKQFAPIQLITLPGCKGITNGRVFTYSKDQLVFLYEISFEIQIKTLLERCAVDDALQVLRQNVGQNTAMINQTKLDAIWPLLRKLQLQKAKDLMKEIDFDVRQLIALYPQYLSLSNQQAMKPQKTMSLFISENLQEKQIKKGQELQRETAEYKKRAKLFLKEVLQRKRQKFIVQANKQHLKERIRYPTSKYSQSGLKMQDATLQEILQFVDYALIKWYLEWGMYKQLEEFLSNNHRIYCTNLFSDFENQLKSNKLKEQPTLISRFYASFGRLDQALENWHKVSEMKDETKAQIACEQAVKILSNLEDREKILNNLQWILKRKPEIGMSLFARIPENLLPSDQMIRLFESDESDTGRYCLQLYLEILVLQKNTEEERLHTKLIVKYLENLFKVRRRDSKEEVNTPQFNEKLAKMRNFLRSEEAKYASEVVLQKIKGCQWLLEDEIYLYSREKKHDEALQKLINKSMLSAAEKYCEENQDKTLTKYFTKLITGYHHYVEKGNNSSVSTKKYIMKFLREYVNHPELDAITVMQLIPDDWMLNEETGGGLYDFLQSAISHTLHQKRSLNTAKHLSEMDLLNVQFALAKTKQANVRFTYTKKCRICHKPIADKIFVVFPNGIVCHQACIKKDKNTICPVTGQDFQKTFKS